MRTRPTVGDPPETSLRTMAHGSTWVLYHQILAGAQMPRMQHYKVPLLCPQERSSCLFPAATARWLGVSFEVRSETQ